jgi:hypothetical protein
MAEKLPRPPASDAAALGTALHTLVENCLNDVDYLPAPGIVDGVDITIDHIVNKVMPAVDAFEDLFEEYGCNHHVALEEWVQIADDVGGTADVLALSDDGKTLIVGDYKSGDGVMVAAENNKQGMFYALCALKSWGSYDLSGVQRVVIAIVQPSERKKELCDVWETSKEAIEGFGLDVMAAVANADRPEPIVKAGSWCTFCPNEAICPEKTGLTAKVERLPVNSLEVKQLGEALSVAGELENWIKAVRKLAHEQAELGVPIKGFKLVNKRATRQWADPAAIEDILRKARKIKNEDAFISKLVSPAQLEKVCKAKGVDFKKYSDYAVSVSSGTTLAPESDKRPSALPSAGLKALAAKI